MGNITIHQNGGTIIICGHTDELKAKANEERDKLLNKMFWARYKDTLGGYEAWKKLVEMYHCGEYEEMCEHIKNCKGKGGKTRNECLESLSVIIAYERRNTK